MQKRQPTKPCNGRQAAALALLRTERDHAYSNLLIGKICRQSALDRREEQLARALYYGVLERQITLDSMLSAVCQRAVEQLDAPVRICLRMGVYQLRWMESVTDFAAVNETVELVKWLGCKSASGFVNGILRSMIKKDIRIPEPSQSAESMSIAYGCPLWLVETWMQAYGREHTETILKNSLEAPPIYLRVNSTKISLNDLKERLQQEGVIATPVEGVENAL